MEVDWSWLLYISGFKLTVFFFFSSSSKKAISLVKIPRALVTCELYIVNQMDVVLAHKLPWWVTNMLLPMKKMTSQFFHSFCRLSRRTLDLDSQEKFWLPLWGETLFTMKESMLLRVVPQSLQHYKEIVPLVISWFFYLSFSVLTLTFCCFEPVLFLFVKCADRWFLNFFR